MAEFDPAVATADPAHKRRVGKRTARACDECRLRKAKCDGLNPCEACRTTDRYCTFNLSAARSTGSGTRIRILEDRLRRARAYLTEAQKRTPSLAHINFDALLGPNEDGTTSQVSAGPQPEDEDNEESIASMMNSYGQMAVTNGSAQRDFFGPSSGLAWIKKTQHYLGDSSSDDTNEVDGDQSNLSAAVQIFDAPLPSRRENYADIPARQLLPPREKATQLRNIVFAQVYPMFPFLTEEQFDASTDSVYSRYSDSFTEENQSFLPLLYLVLAMGYLFSRDEHDALGCRTSVGHAMQLFLSARSMLDIAQLRTIVSLQTIICLILFLISTARMASAHAFLGAACGAAMRQGLHFRSTHDASIPDAERKVRRQVFWAVTNLDMYVSSILGLPQFMNLTSVDPAIDQTIAAALSEGVSIGGPSSVLQLSLAASAKHMELMRIIFKAQGTLYPKPTDPPNSNMQNGTIAVSVSKLQKVEDQFQEWASSLTTILSYPSSDTQTMSIKYEVQISYYFAQIVLYRAFVHYLAEPDTGDKLHQRQLKYALRCVKMAAKVIELSIDHQGKGLLCPASWSSIYTVFLSTICLIFSYATRDRRSPVPGAKNDIEDAIRLLACTACTTDTGSVRCLEILRRLLRRVNNVVDIDLDLILSETKPCCTVPFNQRSGPAQSQSMQSSQPSYGMLSTNSESPVSTNTTTPGQNWAIDNSGWNFDPEQPNTMEYTSYPGGQIPLHNVSEEEDMQVPYGGTFSWPGHQFHMAAARLGQPQGNSPNLDYGNFGTQQASEEGAKLSSADIAAFMHINALDEPYRCFKGEAS